MRQPNCLSPVDFVKIDFGQTKNFTSDPHKTLDKKLSGMCLIARKGKRTIISHILHYFSSFIVLQKSSRDERLKGDSRKLFTWEMRNNDDANENIMNCIR